MGETDDIWKTKRGIKRMGDEDKGERLHGRDKERKLRDK